MAKKQIDEDEIVKWGTDATNGLSQRMALRLAQRQTKTQPGRSYDGKKRSVKDMLTVGLGVYNFDRPEWWPDLKKATHYSDDWEDWTDAELETLKQRLQVGADPEMLYWVFKVPEFIQAHLNAKLDGIELSGIALARLERDASESLSTKEPKAPKVSEFPVGLEQYDTGEFTPEDTPDLNMRRYCNQKFAEYGVTVDLDKPANAMTVKMMIVYQVQFQKIQKRLNGTDKKASATALNEAAKIRDGYSKCAADVALLEKQYKMEPDSESLDSIILLTHDIRKNWREMEIQNEMGMRGLFDMVEAFHRTHLDEDGNKPELEIPEVTPSRSTRDTPYNHDAIAIEQSDKGVEMVVDG